MDVIYLDFASISGQQCGRWDATRDQRMSMLAVSIKRDNTKNYEQVAGDAFSIHTFTFLITISMVIEKRKKSTKPNEFFG